MTERWVWISGWAISAKDFRRAATAWKPQAEHHVVPPSPRAVDQARALSPSHLGAYSLGSLLILERIQEIPPEIPVLCLAPILAFCREANRGGTTPFAVLDSLRKRLRKNPAAALKLFYHLAGISPPLKQPPLPDTLENLDWGLRALQEKYAPYSGFGNVTAVIATQDRLLNTHALTASFKETQRINTNHDYRKLFEHLPQQA